jgi:hypothetical protein
MRRQKLKKYNLLVRDLPDRYGGVKLYYDQDTDLERSPGRSSMRR